MSSPLVFPVGHHLGPVHPAVGADPVHHLVRVGWQSHRVAPGDAITTWALAHGTGAPGDTPWTRQTLLDTAAAAGLDGAERQLDELARAGLIALVGPGDVTGFAAAHRLRPLLVGLGASAADPFQTLGIPGLPPSARVRPRVAEVWRWVGLWPDLASSAAALGQVAGGAYQPDAGAGDLDVLLDAVQILVAASAAHLDVAGGGRAARRHDLPG